MAPAMAEILNQKNDQTRCDKNGEDRQRGFVVLRKKSSDVTAIN